MNDKPCPQCFQSIDGRASRCNHCGARQADATPLHRDVKGRMLAGVCAAVAQQLNLDVALVRVLFAIFAMATVGMAFSFYMLMWLLTPYELGGVAPAERFLRSLGSLFNRDASRGQPIPETDHV